MKFSEEAWGSIEPIYQQILKHPFNRELANGTLAIDKFQFYLKQDSLYLIDFARALAICASKAPTPEDLLLILKLAEGAVVDERGMQQAFFDRYDIELDVEQGPGCLAYTSFLIASAQHRSYAVGAAALLPCFWIYREVGLVIHAEAVADNPYQAWIDTYSGEEFSAVADQAIDWTDRAAAMASATETEAMKQAFIHSTRLEWNFWDSAYRLDMGNI